MALTKANTYDKDDLIVGRGRLYFNRRKNGVYLGERYLGNTTELSLSSSVDKLDHYSSDHGFKDKDKTVNIENSRSGSFTTDIISVENVALWFGGDYSRTLFSAQNDVVEVVNNGAPVSKGFIYQLGVTAAAPQGQGGIDGSSFSIGYADANTAISAGTGDISSIPGVTVLSTANYELDADRGMLYIEEDAPDVSGEVKLVVKYNRKASSGDVIISGDEIIEGSLRFISDNPTGVQKNYFIPLITISADGDYALKGDDWQTLGFTFDVLKKDAITAPITIYTNPIIGSGNTAGGTTGGTTGGNTSGGTTGGNTSGGTTGGNTSGGTTGGNTSGGTTGGNTSGGTTGGNTSGGTSGGGITTQVTSKISEFIAFKNTVAVGERVGIKARVLDTNGTPVKGESVKFYIDGTNGTVGNSIDGTITISTDADGYAETTAVFTEAGDCSAIAQISGDKKSVAITATK